MASSSESISASLALDAVRHDSGKTLVNARRGRLIRGESQGEPTLQRSAPTLWTWELPEGWLRGVHRVHPRGGVPSPSGQFLAKNWSSRHSGIPNQRQFHFDRWPPRCGVRFVKCGTTVALLSVPPASSCQTGGHGCRLQGHVGVSGFVRRQRKHGDCHQK